MRSQRSSDFSGRRGRVGSRACSTPFRPGPKDFDFDINQTSVSEERDQAVDFSDSDHDVEQSGLGDAQELGLRDGESLADLEDAKLGAPVGSTKPRNRQTVQPSQEAQAFTR